MTASEFLEALKPWREPKTQAVSNRYNPDDQSCDNGIDFTAVAYRISQRLGGEFTGFTSFCLQYERELGELMRRPGSTETMSWDDLTSAAAMSTFMAWRILKYGQENSWTWGGKKLWRFPIFIPTVYASATGSLSPLLQLMAAVAYISNCFEGYPETSGKKSLWVAQEALYGKGFIVTKSIDIWRWVQQIRYPGGIKQVLAIYFSLIHPLAVYSPTDFK